MYWLLMSHIVAHVVRFWQRVGVIRVCVIIKTLSFAGCELGQSLLDYLRNSILNKYVI